MSVASSLSSIAEKLTSVLSKINTKLVEKGATEAATFNDVYSKLDEISTGDTSIDGSFQVVAVDGAAYGFEKQADEYWQSTNKGVSNSFSVCKVVFNMNTGGTAVFDCINYAEAGHDYGIIGKVDTNLSITNIFDPSSNIAKSFKNSNSSSVQTYSMVIPSGEHFVYVKYRKDNIGNENDDMFKFKVSIASSAATSADILYGKKAYVNGVLIEGAIQTKTGQQGSTITSNGTTSIPQGYHDGGSYVSVNVSTTTANGALGEPSISLNTSTGVITATSNVRTSGYLSTSATSSNTYTLPTNSGGTITPGTSQKTAVAAGKYTTAATYVKGDPNLVAANIKKGVTIFGVNGTYAGSGSSSGSGSYTDFSSCGQLNSGRDGSSLIIGEIPKIDGKTLKHAAVVCVGSSSEIQLRTILSIYYDYDSSIGLQAYYYTSGGQITEYIYDTDFMNETTTGYKFIFPTSYYVLMASPAYRYVAVYG